MGQNKEEKDQNVFKFTGKIFLMHYYVIILVHKKPNDLILERISFYKTDTIKTI
jgi:hypothetical protein